MNEEQTKVGIEPTIIAAIILSATTAACTAGATMASELSRSKGAEIVGDMVNRTKWDWSPKAGCSAPCHGHWGTGPQTAQSSWFTVKGIATKNDISYEEAASQFAGDTSDTDSVNDAFDLLGDGMGGESLAVFTPIRSQTVPDHSEENDYNDYQDYPGDGFMIAFYLKKLPGGHHYAGVAIGSSFNNDEQEQGKNLAKLMREHEDEEYTDPEGKYKTVFSYKTRQEVDFAYTYKDVNGDTQKGKITVAFTPGEQVIFEVTYISDTKVDNPTNLEQVSA